MVAILLLFVQYQRICPHRRSWRHWWADIAYIQSFESWGLGHPHTWHPPDCTYQHTCFLQRSQDAHKMLLCTSTRISRPNPPYDQIGLWCLVYLQDASEFGGSLIPDAMYRPPAPVGAFRTPVSHAPSPFNSSLRRRATWVALLPSVASWLLPTSLPISSFYNNCSIAMDLKIPHAIKGWWYTKRHVFPPRPLCIRSKILLIWSLADQFYQQAMYNVSSSQPLPTLRVGLHPKGS